jgi:hypothetical protein
MLNIVGTKCNLFGKYINEDDEDKLCVMYHSSLPVIYKAHHNFFTSFLGSQTNKETFTSLSYT